MKCPSTGGPGAFVSAYHSGMVDRIEARRRWLLGAEWLLAVAGALLVVPTLPWSSPLRVVTFPVVLAAGGLALGWRLGLGAVLRVALVSGLVGLALEVHAIERGLFTHRPGDHLHLWIAAGWATCAIPCATLAVWSWPRSVWRRGVVAAPALVALAFIDDPLGLHLGAFTWPGGGSYVPEVRGFGGARGIPPVGFVAWGIVGFCSGLALGRSAPRPDERAFPVLQPLLLAALCIKGLALGLGSAVPWALAFGAAALLFHPATAAALARLRPASHPSAAG